MTKRFKSFIFTVVFFLVLDFLQYKIFGTTSSKTAFETVVLAFITTWLWEET